MSEIKAALLKALAGAMDDDDDDRAPAISIEGQIEGLREYARDYARFLDHCPFKPGDIVHPKRGTTIRGRGTPHVVLEARIRPHPQWSEPGSSSNGQRYDMRVAQIAREADNRLAMYWVESISFEPWSDDAP